MKPCLSQRRTVLKVGDLDVIESKRGVRSAACAMTRLLDLDPAKVNLNGPGIALGPPVGATGAIISVKALHESAGQRALRTGDMCIGGGQGIAATFDRV